MKCPTCGKEFTPLAVNQIYCCYNCGAKYRYHNNVDKNYPSITFKCANCGKTVVTEEGVTDKRTRFCCEICEKKFWKHKYKLNNEISSSRVNFRSVEEYAAYERKTNL